MKGVAQVVGQEQGLGPQHRVEQLRRMHGEAVRPGGSRLLLRRVAQEVGGHAALLDETGELVDGFPEGPADFLPAISDDVERLRDRRTRSISVHADLRMVTALALGDSRNSPILVVAGDEARLRDTGWLIADAARLLWLCWQVEASRRTRQRVNRADGAAREAVLHLLMLGERDGARRVAAALGPRLPEPLRVSVVESRQSSREELATRLAEMTRGQAFIVPCPVYVPHLIMLLPETGGELAQGASLDDRLRELVREHASIGETLSVGTSQLVALRDVATGYEQAFHALAHARKDADHYATFSAREDLASVLGRSGHLWAVRFLSPLAEYVPGRPQDPDADELMVTLGSWLAFHHRATAQLKIHRNTLAARLAKIEQVLGCDVHDVATQAHLNLALRLAGNRPQQTSGHDAHDLAALLGHAAVADWAKHQLAPLLAENPHLLSTLRVWLENNTRLDATATALGISVPAVRKRLVRVETVLKRSVLHGPSARYDLYFALQAGGSPQPT